MAFANPPRSVKGDPLVFSLGALQERVALPVDGVGGREDDVAALTTDDEMEEAEVPWRPFATGE